MPPQTDAVNEIRESIAVDVLIIGGGIAGLWTHARLQQEGYKTVLLESDALGAGQTRYAQGIIHGGTKYALTGKLTASSEAVADMPSRWRACYEGKGELDLTQAELLSTAHYLWSTKNLTSRISGFFASKVMRSRSSVVDVDKEVDTLPEIFKNKNFKDQFYRLDEPVFNTLSVIRAIAEPREKSILVYQKISLQTEGQNVVVETSVGKEYSFRYKKLLFLAGQGNEKLLSQLGLKQPEMQLRPLKMVVMRSDKKNKLVDRVYAHCLGASVNPRITITSHYDIKGNIVWYMGGQLAEDGVAKSDDDLILTAQKEVAELIPWLKLKGMHWSALKIDRAEIKKQGATRPDSFSIEENGDVITAWPTKMALSPALADALVEMIKWQSIGTNDNLSLPAWEQVKYASFPWDEDIKWVQS